MDPVNLLGIAGAATVLLAFLLTQFRAWKGDYFIYEFFNFFGSLLLAIYSYLLDSFPLLLLNGIWGGVALWYMIADLRRNARRRDVKFHHHRTFFQKWME